MWNIVVCLFVVLAELGSDSILTDPTTSSYCIPNYNQTLMGSTMNRKAKWWGCAALFFYLFDVIICFSLWAGVLFVYFKMLGLDHNSVIAATHSENFSYDRLYGPSSF